MSLHETEIALLQQDSKTIHEFMRDITVKQNAMEERQRKIENRLAMLVGGSIALQFLTEILVVWLHK